MTKENETSGLIEAETVSKSELSDLLCVGCGKTDVKPFDSCDGKTRCEKCSVLFYKNKCLDIISKVESMSNGVSMLNFKSTLKGYADAIRENINT